MPYATEVPPTRASRTTMALRRDLRFMGVTAEFYVKSVPDTPNPEAYETDIAFFLEEVETPR